MQNFQDLLNRISEAKKIAELPPEGDPRTLNNKIGIIARAKETLNELFDEYKKHAMSHSIFMINSGEKANDFNTLAVENFGCFSLKTSEFYEKIIEGIAEINYLNKPASTNLMENMLRNLESLAIDIGVQSFPMPEFSNKYVRNIGSREELKDLAVEFISDQIGSEIVGVYAVHVLSKKAIESEYKGKNIAIIIEANNKKEEDSLSKNLQLLFKNVFVVDISDDVPVDLDSVEEKLIEVKERINHT